MKTKIYLVLGLIGLTTATSYAQVAINNSASNPNASAILDLNTGNTGVNKGFLAPQVALTNVATAAPVTTPATGLMVYSTSAPTGGNGTGYYYWTGTAWASLNSTLTGSGAATQVAFWNSANSLTGNSNLYWDNTNSWLGIATSTPAQPLDVNLRNNYTTAKFGDLEPVCLVAYDPMIGFNAFYSGLNETYFGSDYAGFIQFNQYIPGGFQILTAPAGTALTAATMTPAMSILNNGYVGIGTIAPAYRLHVSTATDSYAAEFDNSFGTAAIYANATTAGFCEGIQSTGTFDGIYAYPTSTTGYGVDGENNVADNLTDVGSGVWGNTEQSYGYGVIGENLSPNAGGNGIYGLGAGAVGGGVYLAGAGVFGEGATTGIEGYADATSTICWPVYGANDGGARWATLAYYSGTTDYKVFGTGTVSTEVKDNTNQWRVLNCPEAPEILFEDYGTANLSTGKVHIDLDPTFAKNVVINDKHALRVLVTLNDQCNGVYVTNRTSTGFDVVELNNGSSNASFTYEVIANRADSYDDNGTLLSKNADNRFEKGEGPRGQVKSPKVEKPVHTIVQAKPFVAPRIEAKGSSSSNLMNNNK